MDSPIKSVTIVIPAYNEAKALPTTLSAVLAFCKENHWKCVLVNDGSKDDTEKALEEFVENPRLKILTHKLNRGYGGALKTGLAAVDTDYCVTFDADGQHQLEDIPRMLQAMQDLDSDMIVGSRKRSQHSHWYRELGKWIIRRIAAILVPMQLHDLNSGFKAYRTDLVQQYLHLCPNSMAFSDVITLVFINQRHRVEEVEVEVKPRISGESTISTRTAFETILEILNLVMLFNPLRVFLPLSILCVLIGLVWGIPFIILGRGVSVGAMLAIVSGLLLFTLGLVSEQLSQIRKRQK
jgi:glycosyltransferase involved in cell wall biosynthesis